MPSVTGAQTCALPSYDDDATLRGFGFLLRNAKSVEMRNFAIMRCMDDAISIDTDNSNIWLHHLDFFYGKHGSGDHDKGDGACDAKTNSRYCTFSYCHYWDTGKTNLFGMKNEDGPNYLSYHHNWLDHSDSRHPRVRTMSVHVWNNYFDNVAKYGVGAATGASIFVENNYFLKTKKPILSSLQGTDALGSGTFSGEDGGMIKAYGNYFDRSAVNFKYYTQNNPSSKGYDAYETATRDEQVPQTEVTLVGGTPYNNFDTDASVMYQYTPETAADVPATVMGYYGAGRLNHGDFTYTFTDNVGNDDADSAYDSVLGELLDNYKSSLVGIFGEETTPDAPVDPDDPEVPEGTILASFDGTPSNSMFTIGGNYGDGKITYDGKSYKKGVKLDSKGSITFTPAKDYNMTLILATAKSGRDVKLNGEKTTVGGTENTEGKYYEMDPISITAGTQYVLTKGSAESIVMLIKLVPVDGEPPAPTADYYVGWATGDASSFANFRSLTAEQLLSMATPHSKVITPSYTKTVQAADIVGNRQIFFLMWRDDSAPTGGSFYGGLVVEPLTNSSFTDDNVFNAQRNDIDIDGTTYHVAGMRLPFEIGNYFIVNF